MKPNLEIMMLKYDVVTIVSNEKLIKVIVENDSDV